MTLGRRCANVVQMVCVYWDMVFMHITTNIAHVLTVNEQFVCLAIYYEVAKTYHTEKQFEGVKSRQLCTS